MVVLITESINICQWHGVLGFWGLIGSPVSGMDAADFISANGDIAQNGSDYEVGQ